MKIAVSGCAGIGKTTLAQGLAQALELPFIPEHYELFFDQPGKLNAPPERLIPLFKRVLGNKRAREAKHDAYVIDRCPIDLFNLWLSLGLSVKQEETREFYEKCRACSQDYDHVVVPPWGMFPLRQINDGHGYRGRTLDSWVQLRNHAAICGLAWLWLPHDRLIALPQEQAPPEIRLAQALERIRAPRR